MMVGNNLSIDSYDVLGNTLDAGGQPEMVSSPVNFPIFSNPGTSFIHTEVTNSVRKPAEVTQRHMAKKSTSPLRNVPPPNFNARHRR